MKIAHSILLHISVLILCFCNGQASAQDGRVLKPEGEATIEYKVDLEVTPSAIKSCQASLSIEYLQFDTQARVDLTIENPDCGASSGEYTVRIRTKEENGNLNSIEHVESWARDDDAPVESQKTYDIGNNVELIRVSTTKLTCVCNEAVPDDDGS